MQLSDLYRYLPSIETGIAKAYLAERKASENSVRQYLDANREFTLRGGKRFRAVLVLAGYYIASGRAPSRALPAATAMEHYQSWMLIHDDIIDNADERRGGPTIHRFFESRHRLEHLAGSSELYGQAIGITLGDLEESFVVRSIASCRVPAAARVAAIREYSRMAGQTAYGQLLDIRNGTLSPESLKEVDVLRVHRLKSSVYTVVGPLKIGALLAESRTPVLGDLESIGTDLGVAFQLRDDILGAGLGDVDTGKSSNDLVEGKRTLLVVRAWRKGSQADRSTLGLVLGNPAASPEDVERAREIIRSTGSLDYSEKRITELSKRALRRLDRSRAIRTASKPLLHEIADRLVRRYA